MLHVNMVPWPSGLGTCLQNTVHRFESGRGFGMPYKDPERQRAAQRESHERLRTERRIADRKRKAEWKEKIRQYKERPCQDCGVQYPFYVMQFDHVRGEKDGDISTFMCNRQWSKAIAEIEKCDVVCANCHAERTYGRLLKGPEDPRYVH